ncbi:MAG: hypothetical protein JWO86_1546 [Myxococcaceae bacterium]|jgi:hypothetical protein|nr:hypothetical protein [Myxococcaceae bacterium]MEA2752969.1 hypothetical protein [Myxococcales bacterium]
MRARIVWLVAIAPPSRRAGAAVPLEDELPAAIGATSFRVKGHVYQKMKDNVASSVPGGVERLLERIEREDVRDFFNQRFLGGSWYDALPMAPLSYAHARLAGAPLHRFTRERGRIIAQHDVPGIYKALLRLFSPSTLISRLPRVATFYFSFGKASAEQLEPNRARTTLAELPYSLAPMLAGVVEGFISVALEQSGAKGVQVRTLDVCYDGNVVDDIPTASIRHESTWDL